MSESSGDGHKKRGLGSFHGDSMEFCHGRRGTAVQEVMMQLLGSRSHMGQRDNAMGKNLLWGILGLVWTLSQPPSIPGLCLVLTIPLCRTLTAPEKTKPVFPLFPLGGGESQSPVAWVGRDVKNYLVPKRRMQAPIPLPPIPCVTGVEQGIKAMKQGSAAHFCLEPP